MDARILALALMLAITPAMAQPETGTHRNAVKTVAPLEMKINGGGILPVYVSRAWSMPLPGVTRAVLVLHGRLRNADTYYRSALSAQTAAGDAGKDAIMIAPQFLADVDATAHHLPSDTLRWSLTGWQGGESALAPSPVSSFAALDAILRRLADRRIFPDLKHVVVAGHSGGGQVVQRYAIAAQADAALQRENITVRYVVANPSSYAYFNASRPAPAIAAACSGYNDWKYGMDSRPSDLAALSVTDLEQRYIGRRVIYLLGTADTDPNHPALDKSCMAQSQGPHRYARGHAYAAAMQARNGGTPNHTLWDVPGIGHDGDKMLTSPCGLAALFDLPGCTAPNH